MLSVFLTSGKTQFNETGPNHMNCTDSVVLFNFNYCENTNNNV